MIRYAICLPLFFMAFRAMTQPVPTVAATAMNVVYRGIANPLEVALPGVDCDSLVVGVSNAEKLEGSGCEWSLVPGRERECRVLVGYIHRGDTVDAGAREFRVKNVPDPVPYFGGKGPGESWIKWQDLMAAPGVICKMENFEFDLRFEVSGYEFVADTGSGEMILAAQGPALPKEVEKIKRALENGGSFEIRNIRAIGPDSVERTLRPIRLAVVPGHTYPGAIESFGIKNLYWVESGFYRSAQPTSRDFKNLDQTWITDVLNLRRIDKDKRLAGKTRLTLHHLPVKTRKMTQKDLLQALTIIQDSRGRILVHCKHGADRTGAVIAAYRVVVQGWKKEEALREMFNPRFGFHGFWFQNLRALIGEMDVDYMRNELGLDPVSFKP